jgi:hypothetical protein
VTRGGKRKGAGRKSKLNHTERMYLGSVCETRFREIWEEARQARWKARPGVSELHRLHAKFRSVRPQDRRAFLRSAEGRELSEDVELTIREIRRTPAFVDETNRVFTLTAPRPKGVKDDICDSIAREVREKWGLPQIGRRYVLRCWDEYRVFEREVHVDTD